MSRKRDGATTPQESDYLIVLRARESREQGEGDSNDTKPLGETSSKQGSVET